MDGKRGNGRKDRKGNSTRGSTRNTDRLQAFAGRDEQSSADWSNCDAGRLQAVVVGITMLGGAITFGLSRDMGAHSLTLLLDGGRQTLWYNGNSDLNAELASVMETLAMMEAE